MTRLLGADATKPAVLAALRESDVVHLATHGAPEGLFFAGTTGEADATLSMAEVHALELRRTKLVVLSACDTFKGELRSDGVVGITRAFVAAGTPTLVASLWKVDDAATLELMRRFYRELFEDEDGDVAGNAAVAIGGDVPRGSGGLSGQGRAAESTGGVNRRGC